MSKMEYKGYVAQIEFDDSVNEFIGTTVDMRDVLSFGGTNVKELTAAFHKVVDAYLAWCKKDGVVPDKPYQGKLSLRIPPDLHRKVDIAAAGHGTSINAYIEETLRAAVAAEPRNRRSKGGAVAGRSHATR